MSDQEQQHERRAPDPVLAGLVKTVDIIHDRVFNGIPQELRQEMKEELKDFRIEISKENNSTRKLVVGLLVAIILCFAGIIVEERIAFRSQTTDIKELSDSLNDHKRVTGEKINEISK